MKVKTALYTIAIGGGYYNDQNDFVKNLMDQNPHARVESHSYMFEYRTPKEYKGREAEWKEIVKNRNKETSEFEELWPLWNDFSVRVDAEDLMDYSQHLPNEFTIKSTEIIELKIPADRATEGVAAQMAMFTQIGDMTAKTLKMMHEVEDFWHRNIETVSGEQHAVGESFNTRCGQIQPHIGLWNMNETLLLEDSCTDALQDYLNQGWRMIAIQPQPNQRRPDYILGRYNINYDRPDGAYRK